MLGKIIFLNVLLLLVSGCASKSIQSESMREHTIKSSELRIIMRDMNMVVNDEYKSELERDDRRRRYAMTLAENLKEFSNSINKIPKDRLGQNVSENDMILFTQYAKNLNEKAEILNRIAENYEMERLDSAIDNMKLTCNACHSKFRGY